MPRTLTGTWEQPNGDPVANATIHLTAKRTEPTLIIQGISTSFTTNSSGVYNVVIEDGWYQVSVEYLYGTGMPSRRWILGDIYVEDNPASTTINALIIASNPPDDPNLGVFYQILADTQLARDEAEAAAIAAAASAATITPTKQAQWDQAYTERNRWDGGGTGLVPATGRASLELGTAAQANVTTSETDTTTGRVPTIRTGGIFGIGNTGGGQNLPTSGAGSADLQSIPTGMYIALSTSFATPPFGAGVDVYLAVNRGGGSQAEQIAYAFGAVPRKAIRNYFSGSWSAWREEWTTGNLVKTTSNTDATAGSVTLTGDFGVGGYAGPVNAPGNALKSALHCGFYGINSSTTDNPGVSSGGVAFHLAWNETNMWQMVASRSADQIYFRRNNSGVWSADRFLWHDGNLVKTTSATDNTPGRMLQVGDGGLLTSLGATFPGFTTPKQIGWYWANAIESFPGAPAGATGNYSVRVDGTGNITLQQNTTTSANREIYQGISSSSTTAPSNWIRMWHTGNTSADVQALLGAANKLAIGSSIETAGTFTPVVAGTTSAGSATYTVQYGSYQRVGKRVHYNLHVQWTGHTGTGNLRITGLPYTSAGTTGNNSTAAIFRSVFATATGTRSQALLSSGTSYINMYEGSSPGGSVETTIPASGALILNGSYEV